MNTLEAVTTHIREQAAAHCESSKAPGYLAGVYHDGGQTVVAHGVRTSSRGRRRAGRGWTGIDNRGGSS
jgi:hypothetical protein